MLFGRAGRAPALAQDFVDVIIHKERGKTGISNQFTGIGNQK